MFITAVCVLFLIKLRWPKNKSFWGIILHYCYFITRHLFFSFLLLVPHALSQVTCISRNQTAKKKTKRRQVDLIGSCISPPFEGSGAGLQKQGNRRGSLFEPVKHNTVVRIKFIHSRHYHLWSMTIHWCMCTTASPGQSQPRTWYNQLAPL